ncbi:MarR family transcriptional regulator [Aestuariivita sp.]|jgi:DNA-binding MarR family transcriptional regulator|uniref:MarR family winged helix-turn-helix transcriptional regulator n=1 Tax=Aestuariivita sp. TaxID=1872407 RepID=UPI0021701E56|nr:MarR family transcriptional regulator [Aestuariivita sp.]MCE8007935.1 MarR family transcriptional regulator [Aestuariivita sp.]
MTFKDSSAGFLANHMARLFAHALAREIGPLGLAPAQFMVLLELWEEDGVTQAALVAALDVEQATMANTLSRMERDGLITRHPNLGDKRARNVCLTDRARALRPQAMAAARQVNARALSSLDAQDQAQLSALMQQVIAALKRSQP